MRQETMTSRERVIRAMNPEPVDRVPIDLDADILEPPYARTAENIVAMPDTAYAESFY